jgi:hypothetical protein
MHDTILLRNARKLIDSAYEGDNTQNGDDSMITPYPDPGLVDEVLQGGVMQGSQRFARILPEV